MEKLYSIFPKVKRRQSNIHNSSDSLLHNSKTNSKFYQFDSDCHSTTDLNFGAKSNASNSNKSQSLNVSTSDYGLEEDNMNTGSWSLHSGEKENTTFQFKEKNKLRKNTFVININNSKYFHIGPQQTISINANELEAAQPFVNDHPAEVKIDLKKLFDCEQKLSEECIRLISLHLQDEWKKFIKYLGVKDNILEMLELRNDNDQILIVYDALEEYLNLFPNTSLGFIFNALYESHQGALIEKLAQELNIY